MKIGRGLLVVALMVGLVWPSGVAADSGGSGGTPPFSDVGGGVHASAVGVLAAEGVFEGTGCGPGLFCPDEPLRRSTMAVWLVRMLDGAGVVPAVSGVFADVDYSQGYGAFADRLSELGVTHGCAVDPLRYCPDSVLTRGQMAAFLVRAFGLEEGSAAGFADVGVGHAFADDIGALAASRVTAGCSAEPLRFCPGANVTRAQMATFLARAAGRVELPDPAGAQSGEPSTQGRSHVLYMLRAEPGDPGALWLADAGGSTSRRLAADVGNGSRLIFIRDAEWVSPTGEHIQYLLRAESPASGADLYELWVTDVEGEFQRKLTDYRAPPRASYRSIRLAVGWWSPDGRYIAYEARFDDDSDGQADRVELWVANADGSDRRRLSDRIYLAASNGAFAYPWSPDGSQIRYYETRRFYETGEKPWVSGCEIWVAAVDGSNRREVADGVSCLPLGWSPDSTRVLYKNRGSGGLWVVSAHGAGPPVEVWSGASTTAEWSPSGDHVAVHVLDNGGTPRDASNWRTGVWVAAADGAGTPRLLTSNLARNGLLWSPDGSRVTFQTKLSDTDGDGLIDPFFDRVEVWVANADATDKRKVTDRGTLDNLGVSPPAVNWSPDSSRFIYTEWLDTTGNGGSDTLELHVATADGSGSQQLSQQLSMTSVPGGFGAPLTRQGVDGDDVAYFWNWVWSPDASRVMYWSDFATRDLRVDLRGELWVANADGTRETKAAEVPRWTVPMWSIDGSYIGFRAPDESGLVTKWTGRGDRDVTAALWIASADGSDPRIVVSDEVGMFTFMRSRHSRPLLYLTSSGLWTANVDGSDPRLIDDDAGSSPRVWVWVFASWDTGS